MNHTYFVGLDLGQSQDPTAIAVVERADLRGDWDPANYAFKKETRLRLRYLERVPLGTSYPDIVDRVAALMRSPSLGDRKHLAVDATGVGRPVVDLLRRAGLASQLWPILITGAPAEGSSQKGFYSVPKRDLIIGLQVMLQNRELQFAQDLPEGPRLLLELRQMRVKINPTGNQQFGAWGEGEHDDLVLALSMACWAARKTQVVGAAPWCAMPTSFYGTGRLF